MNVGVRRIHHNILVPVRRLRGVLLLFQQKLTASLTLDIQVHPLIGILQVLHMHVVLIKLELTRELRVQICAQFIIVQERVSVLDQWSAR